MPGEYHDWLDDVEPAWTILDPARFEALMGEPSSAGGPLRLAVDLTDGEVVNCAIVRNALVLLRAASEGDGLKLTVRGNLARAEVSAMREAMEWPGCAFEEKWRAGKQLSEQHVEELRLVRGLLEEARLVQHIGGRLRPTAAGRAAPTGRLGWLHAELFRIAFWRVSLDLFGDGECGSWPQQQIGPALWSLSTTGHGWQATKMLMQLGVLPDQKVLRNPEFVGLILFATRVLRPLLWFGLVEWLVEDASREGGMWRKSALFDRFLRFGPSIARTEGPLH